MTEQTRDTRGDLLQKAIETFEARFERVDDHYMHTGASRTVEDVRFRKIYPGSPDVTQPVSFGDRYGECVEAWLDDMIEATASRPNATILFWSVRPHFVAIPSGGITIESSFAAMIPADISEETIQRWNEADLERARAADAADAAAAAEAPATEETPKKKKGKKTPDEAAP